MVFGQTVEMKFVDDHIAPKFASVIEIKVSGITTTTTLSSITFTPALATGVTAYEPVLYEFMKDAYDSENHWSNVGLALGYGNNACWNPTDGQILGSVNTVRSTYVNVGLGAFLTGKEGVTTFTMRCSFPILHNVLPTHNTLKVTGFGATQEIMATLAWPAQGVQTPNVNLVKA
jgi:hypothetical protein